MSPEARERFLLPFLLPLGALAFIGLVVFGMSRVLLNVPKAVATSVALMVAFNVLIAAWVLAVRPSLKAPQKFLMSGVAVLPIVLGGLVAAGAVEVKGGDEHAHAEEVEAVTISAEKLVFDKKELKVPAGQEFKMRFQNKDTDLHNVAILKEKGSTEVLFREPPFAGPETVTWDVKAIPAGSYFFQCDVHPNMSGTVVAEGGELPGERTGASGSDDAVEVAADNLAFDTKTLQIPANVEFKMAFNNEESAPHNVAILAAKGSPEVLFRQPPVAGPKKVTWDVNSIPPGNYYFQCDVHPNMNGQVVAG